MGKTKNISISDECAEICENNKENVNFSGMFDRFIMDALGSREYYEKEIKKTKKRLENLKRVKQAKENLGLFEKVEKEEPLDYYKKGPGWWKKLKSKEIPITRKHDMFCKFFTKVVTLDNFYYIYDEIRKQIEREAENDKE